MENRCYGVRCDVSGQLATRRLWGENRSMMTSFDDETSPESHDVVPLVSDRDWWKLAKFFSENLEYPSVVVQAYTGSHHRRVVGGKNAGTENFIGGTNNTVVPVMRAFIIGVRDEGEGSTAVAEARRFPRLWFHHWRGDRRGLVYRKGGDRSSSSNVRCLLLTSCMAPRFYLGVRLISRSQRHFGFLRIWGRAIPFLACGLCNFAYVLFPRRLFLSEGTADAPLCIVLVKYLHDVAPRVIPLAQRTVFRKERSCY